LKAWTGETRKERLETRKKKKEAKKEILEIGEAVFFTV
jgi:hypothetical protein